ncbi:hypothetical protein GCM10011519_13550 [Marmoricola endophyticus]|uniref:DUF4397 domain-containing protein n=1 Tax=Marmoricola endophyticus TaxID=2040280 RepID=A0A917BF69_9ACTN|nr:DUF4397 domain-containing protein [Marmoricola endophyticus]GGF41109.1 hypothetical protein GCM10011519_13550 [Marmoricola endophyticus]
MSRLSIAGATGATALIVGVLLALPAHADAPSASSAASGAQGQVTVVQALPGSAVGVSVDGRSVQTGASAGSVLGPYSLAPGAHEISFSDVEGTTVTEKVEVAAGGSRDVVLHLPEAVDGKPEVNVYDTPTTAIGPEKSRVLVAHTANVGAADVAFDGTVVFDGVTNGQFAEADVPSGEHEVQLFPAGQDTTPVLGPLSMTLPSGTVTMTYAYGNPATKSMKVVSHTATLSTTGTAAPQRIHTGSAGLASAVPTAFGLGGAQQGVAGWITMLSWVLALPTLALLGLSVLRRTRGESGLSVAIAGERRRRR